MMGLGAMAGAMAGAEASLQHPGAPFLGVYVRPVDSSPAD